MSVAVVEPSLTDLAIIAMPLVFALGALLGYLAYRPRTVVVPAELDVETPDMAETVEQARAALTRFTDRHDLRELKDIGWDVIGIVEAARRAEIQIGQAEAAPAREKERREALAAFNRLRDRVRQLNKRIAQFRDGSWPDE